VGTHEGQGRNIITAPGTNGMLLPGNCKILLGRLPGDAKAAIKPHEGLAGEWQQIEIIVRGNTMIHMLNGQVMSITVDDDPVAHRWASFVAARGQRPDLVPERLPQETGQVAGLAEIARGRYANGARVNRSRIRESQRVGLRAVH
jgi:hypothetical protein